MEVTPYPTEGSPSQERPDPYLSRSAEFNSGLQGGGTGQARSVQQDANTGFQNKSVLAPYTTPNGVSQQQFQKTVYRY